MRRRNGTEERNLIHIEEDIYKSTYLAVRLFSVRAKIVARVKSLRHIDHRGDITQPRDIE